MIFVVGPGRSGTSRVAKYLHENGINMGEEFVPPNPSNPEGFYEDIEFRNLDNDFLDERIDTREFIEGLKKLRAEREEPWGAKDPRIAQLLPFYLSIFENPLFVRCHRYYGDIVRSMMRWYGWSHEEAGNLLHFREKQLDKHLRGYEVINIKVEEDKLSEKLDEPISSYKSSH